MTMLAIFFVARISLSTSNIGFPYSDDSDKYPTPQRHFISVSVVLFALLQFNSIPTKIIIKKNSFV